MQRIGGLEAKGEISIFKWSVVNYGTGNGGNLACNAIVASVNIPTVCCFQTRNFVSSVNSHEFPDSGAGGRGGLANLIAIPNFPLATIGLLSKFVRLPHLIFDF